MTSSDFLKRNLKRSTRLTILFFLTNLLILAVFTFIFITVQQNNDYYDTVSLGTVTDSFNGTASDGSVVSKESLAAELEAHGQFAFRINEDGTVSDAYLLPDNLNHPYSRSDIAMMSRWFLDDYPVKTDVQDDGSIIVLGYPKGSFERYNLVFSIAEIQIYLWLFPALLLGNLALFLYLQWSNAKKTEKAVGPVLEGITALSRGQAVNLKASGPLAQINEELNTASSRAQQRENNRAEWISGISHDIRTPLTVITGCSEALEQEPEKAAVYGPKIRYNTLKIQNLVNTLNLNSKLNYGLIPADLKPVNAAECFRNSIIGFLNENNMEQYPLNVEISPESETSGILADQNLIDRMTANLLANSMIHNPDGTEITVSLATGNGEAILLVSDNGTGVNAQELEALENDSLSGYDTHGQGLKLVRKIADLHGGSVRFKSDNGMGFCTEVRIPLGTE
ncbi:MAG: sensor histidine kinase [Eubacteriaceae bacterium]|jgi:signal transduction histidine kinase